MSDSERYGLTRRIEARLRRTRGRLSRAIIVWPMVMSSVAFAATEESGSAARRLADLTVPFVENVGQAADSVGYFASTPAGNVSVTRDGALVYLLRQPDSELSPRATQTLTERLRATRRIRPRGTAPTETNVSYLRGSEPRHWRRHVHAYERIDLGEAWPGVHVALRVRGGAVEKVFTVAPGSNAGAIRVAVEPGARLMTTAADTLHATTTSGGEFEFSKPIAYREIGGIRRDIEVAYRVFDHEYGFSLGVYDESLPLVIDPFLQATYLGGGSDDGTAVAIDPASGEVLLAGGTLAPVVPGATEIFENDLGRADVFVARFNADLTALSQLTYYGDGADDVAFALAVHPATGNVYLGGRTRSQLPGTNRNPGGQTGFVATLDPTMTTVLGATFLGGGRISMVLDLAIHPTSGDVYATGYAEGDRTAVPLVVHHAAKRHRQGVRRAL